MSSPFLDQFFSSMERYLREHPRDVAPLLEAYPAWDASATRVGLYGRFVEGHVRRVTGSIYAGCRDLLGDRWEGLLDDYYRLGPAGADPRINGCGRAFVAFLAERGDLPDAVLDVARFEWAKLECYYEDEEVPGEVDRLRVNPTLRTLEHPWKICSYYTRRKEDPSPPEPGDEVALIWRNPATGFVRWRAANPRFLLALKLAHEEIPLEEAAAAGGVPMDDVLGPIQESGALGLVLLPPELQTDR